MTRGQEPDLRLEPSVTTACAVATESFACGKVIIVGEHAVVYGAGAVAMPLLHHRMHLKLNPECSDSNSERPYIRFTVGDKQVPQHVSQVVNDAFSLLGVKPFRLSLRVSSDIPVGAGLGSSATLCVAILRAIADSVGMRLQQSEIAKFANQLEERFHGKPSGLDTSVVSYESAILFRKGEGSSVIQIGKTFHFAVIDSLLRASTLAMIRQAAPFFSGTKGNNALAEFDSLSIDVASALENGDPIQLGCCMNEAHHLLLQAGVVNSELSNIIDTCKKNGAIAAKVTGAGGGGCILALLDSNHSEDTYAQMQDTFGRNRVFKVSIT